MQAPASRGLGGGKKCHAQRGVMEMGLDNGDFCQDAAYGLLICSVWKFEKQY